MPHFNVMDFEGKCHVGFIMGKAKLSSIVDSCCTQIDLGAAILVLEIAELVVSEQDIKPLSSILTARWG